MAVCQNSVTQGGGRYEERLGPAAGAAGEGGSRVVSRGMKRRMERLEQAARDLRTQAAAGGYWAELFLAAREASDEPTAEERAAAEAFAEAFVADCRARGVKPTWVELVRLAERAGGEEDGRQV